MAHVWYNSPVEKHSKGIGVIDALTAGFELVARRPWAILLPVVVNLLIWLGPRLSVAPLTAQVADIIRAGIRNQSGQYAEAALTAARALSQWGEQFNLVDLLAVGLPALAVPAQAQRLLPLSAWGQALASAGGLLVLGGYLLALYLTIIARQVQGRQEAALAALARAARVIWRLVALGVVILGIGLVVTLPAMMVIGVISFLYPQGAVFLATVTAWLAIGFLVWVSFYLFFAADAMVLDDAGVRQAVSKSATLVRLNGGATAMLIALTLTLTWGLGVVWEKIAASTVGAVAAIVANAYVSSALVAASLIFYTSRWRALEERMAALVALAGKSVAPTDRNNSSGE